MPACLRVGSRVEPMNLSGPGWRYHSPARGLIAGSMMSSGVALPFEPTRLYQTTMLCARASSCSRFRFGIAATQRGRAVQLPFIISRNRRAVVEGSTVTSFSSGGGGATAEFQSEMTANREINREFFDFGPVSAIPAPQSINKLKGFQ